MPLYRDQTGHLATIPSNPQRVISLVPSQTELLYDLGLGDRVIGITKFCIHPDQWFRQKTRVGGTKNLHLETIQRLQPDLILANKEENSREQVESLQSTLPVWTSDIQNLPQALDMIKQVGIITDCHEQAISLLSQIKEGFASMPSFLRLRVCYLIWQDPYMTVGGDTFINVMLERCGFENVFKNSSRYPVISAAEIISYQPDLLLLSSEPYPFSQKHIDEWKKQNPSCPAMLVNGEFFSWYGSRLAMSPAYFINLRRTIDSLI